MITKSKFKSAWWLPGPHLQTLWPTLMRRKIPLDLTRERIELPDGDFIDLDWVSFEKKDAPLVIVLHGLEGSIHSQYARGILRTLQKAGNRAVLMHFRGCSGEHNRLPRAYHSGETKDIATIVNILKNRTPDVPIYAIGYSLGGNVLLKWLGETQNENPLDKAVAISVPFELNKLADKMNTGFSKIYQRHLLNLLIQKFKDKHKLDRIHEVKSFWDFDNHFTAPLHGFKDAMDYYLQSSSRQYLKNIQKPTLIIHAENDPFMTLDVIPQNSDLSQYITLEISNSGGHVGFVSGIVPGLGKYWLEERISNFLKS